MPALNIDKAIETMEQAVNEHPESSNAYFHLGNYMGLQGQRTQDYGQLIFVFEQAFQAWDKALELDSNNFEARFTRGAWSVSVPKFVGRLETGIHDLKLMVEVLQRAPDVESQAQLANAYYYLGTGYQKQGAVEKAKQTYKKVIVGRMFGCKKLRMLTRKDCIQYERYMKRKKFDLLKKKSSTKRVFYNDLNKQRIPCFHQNSDGYRIN